MKAGEQRFEQSLGGEEVCLADGAAPGARRERPAQQRAERVVFVKGDPDLPFETVAHAIDIAKGAGIDKIGLITPKIELGQ